MADRTGEREIELVTRWAAPVAGCEWFVVGTQLLVRRDFEQLAFWKNGVSAPPGGERLGWPSRLSPAANAVEGRGARGGQPLAAGLKSRSL
jgi:hypothetical protein